MNTFKFSLFVIVTSFFLYAAVKTNGQGISTEREFYISASGDDNNPGSRQSPFLTIDAAKKAIRNSYGNNGAGNYTIWLAEGTYSITDPVVFGSFEFGEPDLHLFIKALPGEIPVISGGKELSGWKKNKSGLWETKCETISPPRELFVNGKRAIRARYPNEGFLRVKQVGEDRRTHFFFEKNEFPVPARTGGVELVFLHDWSISRIGVQEINQTENRLTAVDSLGAKVLDFFNLDNWEEHPRYFLENSIEFLDEDYEWVYDREQDLVILKLPDFRNPEDLQIIIPVTNGIIKLEGNDKISVKNIHFEGISFKHCAWQIPEKGYCGIQACHFDPRPAADGWSVVPAAIQAEWAQNCSFKNCLFENFGTSGVWLSTGCRNCFVLNSGFRDISGNGIMIGEGNDRRVNGNPWWQELPDQVAHDNIIGNCSLSECGVQFYGAVGIWCGLTANTIIRNNQIYDLPYSGISVGWMWSPVPTPCRENIIDGNHIHNILNTLSDGGGIYMLGLQPGSRLINNHIHDVRINAGRAESNGMFLDEGTTNVIVANNLIYNIAKSPLRFHKATVNLVQDNYLFCMDGNPPIRYNRTNETDIRQVNNRIFSDTDENYEAELEKVLNNWRY